MLSNRLTIIVEGEFDRKVAYSFLRAAGIPMDRLEFYTAGGSREIKKLIEKLEYSGISEPVVVLMDLDDSSNYESEKRLKEKYGLNKCFLNVFPAIPTIEAWLFADIEAARKKAKNKKRADELLSRIPMPDEIPYPRHLAVNLFALNEKFELINDDVDIKIAMSRSPSLRKFIIGVATLLNFELNFNWEEEYARTSGRDVFSKLVDEIIPAETVIYRTLNGDKVTASEMSRHIQEGSQVGLRYSVELLRVARDFLAREARRNN
ncbi:hypothetical protein [Vibrio splendidus]|uniref:hypothetical protein n=1 Tax=Vibrio splendidus TaxID=29497 RepID=UPI0034A0B2C1